ncbi:hypothetical protein L596_019360 [Steinernema carpocapsae]|uniref:G-protein coupled receptors family 1 profile domain-containing protein n=1 Tax=Steinernema carpocapsae TaxID=34508 RepID=A0A4U5MQF3_STECR|nr:hypothetical protein L596_019360 [Steinernema carpocapsae]
MDALVSLVEYFLTAIFCLFTVFFVIKTLITRTLAKTWKECPALVVFFLYVIALALGTTLMAVEWALVDLNLLSTKADFSLKLLHNSGVAGVSLRWCYDCATLGIVIQRIWYLKSPFAYLSGLKSLVLGFDIIVPAFLVIGFVYINASNIQRCAKTLRRVHSTHFIHSNHLGWHYFLRYDVSLPKTL